MSSRTLESAAETTVVIQPAAAAGIAPLAALHNAVRFWWVMVLLAIAGGVAGWLMHRSQPPVYEAAAQFSVGLDYINTGPLTQYEEDTALNAVGDLVSSSVVVNQVVKQANSEGIAIQAPELRRNVTVERKVNIWVVRVRSNRPTDANRLAAIWVVQGQNLLEDSYQHALQADHINRMLRNLENCLSGAALSEPSIGLCSQSQFSEIQKNIQQAGQAYGEERIASRGLFSGLLLGPAELAYPADKPVLYGQNQLVLFGCLIGLLLGAWITQLNFLGRWLDRS